MIEKRGKGNLVSNLRTINLMEVDFNFNNKVISRALMYCAEKNHLIPMEQYRSYKEHRAIHQATNKRLLYNIAYFQKCPMILYNNNVKSCYDQIVHSIASLSLQRLSMLLESIKYIFLAIQKMDHYVHTAFGISESKLCGLKKAIPNQGIL